jgi:hypothetical protein
MAGMQSIGSSILAISGVRAMAFALHPGDPGIMHVARGHTERGRDAEHRQERLGHH